MTKRFSNKSRFLALGLAVTAAVAMPLSASARGWGDHDHGYRGGYDGGYHRGYEGHERGHWSGGRWIAGAIVTGAVIGLVSDALRPAPVYYDQPMVYSRPRTVIYDDYPPVVVHRRVIERRTVVYDDPYQTRYIGRDDDDD